MGEILSMLRIEWLKIKYYRTFWLLLAVITVSIPAFNYMVYDFTTNNIPKFNGQSILGNPFSFPGVWKMVPYNAGLITFMPAIMIITLFTNEYSYRTHRQNIIDGWSRSGFITIKIIEVFLLSLFVTLLVLLTCLYFGFLTLTDPQSFAVEWEQFRFIFYFFVEMLDYLLIAALIATLIKRAGLAMGLFFLYMFVEQLVVAIGRNKYKKDWVNYLPQEVSDRLIPNPLGGKGLPHDSLDHWEKLVPVYLSVAIAYIIIYIYIISWRFRKAEL